MFNRSPEQTKIVRGHARAALLAQKGWEVTGKIEHVVKDAQDRPLSSEESIIMTRPRRRSERMK